MRLSHTIAFQVKKIYVHCIYKYIYIHILFTCASYMRLCFKSALHGHIQSISWLLIYMHISFCFSNTSILVARSSHNVSFKVSHAGFFLIFFFRILVFFEARSSHNASFKVSHAFFLNMFFFVFRILVFWGQDPVTVTHSQCSMWFFS